MVRYLLLATKLLVVVEIMTKHRRDRFWNAAYIE